MNFEAAACPLCGSEEALPLLQILSRRMVRCRRCGLVYQNPLSTAGDLLHLWPLPAREDGSEELEREWGERAGKRRSQRFRQFLHSVGRPGRLLDIGCGYGFFLKLAQEAGWEAIGLELNQQAVAYAKDRLQVNALLGDPRHFHFPDASFDLVTFWNVLDYVPDPLELLEEVHRVLKAGGHVFIRTPNFTWHLQSFRLISLLRRLRGNDAFAQQPYFTFVFKVTSFSRATLRLLLERSGFVPVTIKNSPPVPGDPYLELGTGAELALTLAKRAVHAIALTVAALSGNRWLIGPSLEAWGRREA